MRPPRHAVSVRGLTMLRAGQPVFERLSLQVPEGALMALVGANGAGKTTLLETIAGLHAPARGSIIMGVARERLALLPQRHGLDLDIPCTVREFVALGAWPRIGVFRALQASDQSRIAKALHCLHLEALARRPIDALSPGELQRARFAQLMVRDAQLLLLDEPFAALDDAITRQLLGLIHRWHAQRRTVIVVLHDQAQVRAHFPAVVQLWRTGVCVSRATVVRSLRRAA